MATPERLEEAESVPHVGEQAIPACVSIQVTPLLKASFITVAVKAWVVLIASVCEDGETITVGGSAGITEKPPWPVTVPCPLTVPCEKQIGERLATRSVRARILCNEETSFHDLGKRFAGVGDGEAESNWSCGCGNP